MPNNTQRHTLGRTHLDERSGRRKDLYLTTHNNHKRQPSTPPTGFEPAIPANEGPQTHPLDCAATGIGDSQYILHNTADRPVLILKGGIIYRVSQMKSAFYCVISKILNSLWTVSNVHSSVCRAVNMSQKEFHAFKAFIEAK